MTKDLEQKIRARMAFSEHDAYYRLGYDSEREPGVDKIIEGARVENRHLTEKLAPLLAQMAEALAEHKWHEDACEYRQKFHLNNEKLCDCGAFKAKSVLEKLEAWLAEGE